MRCRKDNPSQVVLDTFYIVNIMQCPITQEWATEIARNIFTIGTIKTVCLANMDAYMLSLLPLDQIVGCFAPASVEAVRIRHFIGGHHHERALYGMIGQNKRINSVTVDVLSHKTIRAFIALIEQPHMRSVTMSQGWAPRQDQASQSLYSAIASAEHITSFTINQLNDERLFHAAISQRRDVTVNDIEPYIFDECFKRSLALVKNGSLTKLRIRGVGTALLSDIASGTALPVIENFDCGELYTAAYFNYFHKTHCNIKGFTFYCLRTIYDSHLCTTFAKRLLSHNTTLRTFEIGRTNAWETKEDATAIDNALRDNASDRWPELKPLFVQRHCPRTEPGPFNRYALPEDMFRIIVSLVAYRRRDWK